MLDQISEAIQYLELELSSELWHNLLEKDPSTIDKNDFVLHGCRPLTGLTIQNCINLLQKKKIINLFKILIHIFF